MVSQSSGTSTGQRGAQQATRQDGVQRHGVGRVDEDDPGDLAPQQGGEQAAEGQDRHAADAVPDQHDRASSGRRVEHGPQVPRHAFEAVAAVRGLAGQAEAGQVPEHEAEAVGEVLLLVPPSGRVEVPAVGQQQRRRALRGAVLLDVEVGPVRPGDAARPPAALRAGLVGATATREQDKGAPGHGPEQEGDADREPAGLDDLAYVPRPDEVGAAAEQGQGQQPRQPEDEEGERHGHGGASPPGERGRCWRRAAGGGAAACARAFCCNGGT
jgi:hypothetical protein